MLPLLFLSYCCSYLLLRMKLQCQVEVINRLHSTHNMKSGGKYLKATLALGKEPTNQMEYFILYFSSTNKHGVKYKVSCMKKVFVKCLNEGKATIRFVEPPHDLYIKCETIQLKCFMKLLKKCVTGDTKDLHLSNLCNISVTAKDNAPTMLVIRERSDIPSKGLPRTLESLSLSGLNLCNFRRDILMLKRLTVLDLSNNEIEKLPAELGAMPNLAELHLANNQLGSKGEVDWRWMLGLQITKTLKLLDLTGNKLTLLPKSIWKLQRLVTLKVDSNQLEILPSTLGRIGTLSYLSVSQNKLKSLPCSLMLPRLEQIDLSSNKFEIVPKPGNAFNQTRWEFCVGNLVQIASKVVLKNKLFYAPNIIPLTLVEYLDSANMCVCGNAVMDYIAIKKPFNPIRYFRTVVADNNSTCNVTFDFYFCSFKCSKYFSRLWSERINAR